MKEYIMELRTYIDHKDYKYLCFIVYKSYTIPNNREKLK